MASTPAHPSRATAAPAFKALAFTVLDGPISAKVLRAFRDDAGWPDENGAALRAALAGAQRPGSRVQWVTARAGQKVVALARLELAPPQFCCVSDLIVLSSHRGRGVGAWFMGEIERYCRHQRIARVVLQALAPSRAFYARLHFVDDPLVAGFLKKDIGPLIGPRPGALGLPLR